MSSRAARDWWQALGALAGRRTGLPQLPPRHVSRAIDAATPSPLAQRVAAQQPPPGLTGVRLMGGGEDALATLLMLVDAAQHTLDLQYYAVLDDTSSRVLLQRVRAAGDRGVRVRLLLDDLNTAGSDAALRRLADHPRIEVRLYNPMPAGRGAVWTKVLASLPDAQRVNGRMHNKALIADNVLAVTGGRNVGDPYYLQTEESNFVDLDVLVAGPTVPRLSAVFDRFWNAKLAYPAAALIRAGTARPAADELDAPAMLPEPAGSGVERRLAALRRAPLELVWAPARLIADAPTKPLKGGEPDADETMFDDLGALLGSARRSVVIVTPYFVPGADGMALIRDLRRRGVAVRLLTAALAATDAPIVNAGYGRYRRTLLEAGVELYELRPEYEARRGRGGVHSRTNLHSKAVVVDDRAVLVGSMNIDPRSARLNTEMGLLVRSEALACALERRVRRTCERGAYRLVLSRGRVRWRWEHDGRRIELAHDPGVSFLERTGWALLARFMPERML